MCVQGQRHGSHEWPEYAACKQWLWPACQSRMAGTKPAVPSQLIAVPEVAITTGAQADVSTCSMLSLLLLNCILLSQVLICRFAPQHDSGREGSPPLVTAQMSLPELYVSTDCCFFAQIFTLLNQINSQLSLLVNLQGLSGSHGSAGVGGHSFDSARSHFGGLAARPQSASSAGPVHSPLYPSVGPVQVSQFPLHLFSMRFATWQPS